MTKSCVPTGLIPLPEYIGNREVSIPEKGRSFISHPQSMSDEAKRSKGFFALFVQEEAMSKLKPQLQPIERSPMRRMEKREQPEPSSVWLAAAFAFLSCAAATLVTSLTLSSGAAVRPSELLITAAGLAAMGALCLLAHWDTNRGRKPKRYEVKELSGDE